jgi:homoserine dehydrogenase
MARTGVALLGCGTVGAAVAEFLLSEGPHLASRSGQTITLRHVLVKDRTRARPVVLPKKILAPAIETILHDPQTHIVVEVMGGLEPARTLVLRAIKAKKHVVTANKYLLAIHGKEIFAAARKAGVCVAFEASVGGAIPIISALTKGLLANDINRVIGIVNGTSNYILTQMSTSGESYAAALAGAQAAGYAEPDPTLDVNGTDSAHKLAVLAGLAFGAEVPFDSIETSGIDTLQDIDLKYGRELGYVCKLLAIGEKTADGISLRVHPTFVPADQTLASVNGPFNAISVYGHAAGQTLYYGRGAGPRPTSSAIVADILDVALGTAPLLFKQLPMLMERRAVKTVPSRSIRSRHYLRITALDRPGVMAKITRILGEHDISIAAVVQHETRAGQPVPVVVTTHESADGDVEAAVGKIDGLKDITAKTVRLRMLV